MSHLKDEHLARISHELRNPLAGLRMWLEVLRSGRPEDRAKAIEAIDRSVRDQGRLIDNLLDFARAANGKLRVGDEAVDLYQAVAGAVAQLRADAEARGIHLVLALDRGAGRVRGDAGRLQQVAWNLLSNAVKFTAPGGTIELSLQAVGGEVVLTVTDTGIGLDGPTEASLFTPFQQGEHGSTPVSAGGLGLGLAITRRLVELHGGAIRGENRADGPGARFTVTLPRHVEERLPIPSGDRAASTGAWAPPEPLDRMEATPAVAGQD